MGNPPLFRCIPYQKKVVYKRVPRTPTTKTAKILKKCPGYQYQVEVQVVDQNPKKQKESGTRKIKDLKSHRIHGNGIFTYIWLIFLVNVGKYTIHGSYGKWFLKIKYPRSTSPQKPKMTIAGKLPLTFLMGDTSTHSWWIFQPVMF